MTTRRSASLLIRLGLALVSVLVIMLVQPPSDRVAEAAVDTQPPNNPGALTVDAAGNVSGYFNTASATTASTSGPIALRQHTGASLATTTSASLGFSASTAAGNLIAVVVRGGASDQSFSVTDSQGNTYRQAVTFDVTVDTPAGHTLGIYYAENIAGGAAIVTVSQTIPATLRVAILEYAGIATANALEATAAAQGVSNAPSSGNLTTATGGNLLLGAAATADAATAVAGSG